MRYECHVVPRAQYDNMPSEFRGGEYVDGFVALDTGDCLVVTRHEDEAIDWEAKFRALLDTIVAGKVHHDISVTDISLNIGGLDRLRQQATLRMGSLMLGSLAQRGGFPVREMRKTNGDLRLEAEVIAVLDHERFHEIADEYIGDGSTETIHGD